ncbi:MAG: acyl-CoA dehydrogenase family protein [Acidobacteria bacterium]|nr:acyl-CoA dehydrogenase family protein [Acidobacteriota bacterium]
MRSAPDASSAAAAYRCEVRAWLAEHLTDRHRGLEFTGAPTDDWLERMREWNILLADAGYAAPSWPEEWGGRGAGALEQLAHATEMVAAGAPGPVNSVGIPNIAPAIMSYGTDEQRRRFLRPLLRGEEIWCQGFSEPDAGSDLASLRCAAVCDGDTYRVTGQKIWTTLASVADWCELIVRTDTAPGSKHAGITALLVDMTLPGIDVRPLRNMSGSAEFCEVFFDDVRVPVSSRLGEEGAGWRVATSTLASERGGVAMLQLQLRQRISGLIAEAQAVGRTDDPRVRDQLARVWTSGELLRYLADRSIERAAAGEPPGPESSVIKIAWSNTGQELTRVAFEVLGMAAFDTHWVDKLAASRAMSIAGGTTEVNRNIVAERVLGLPRDP